MNIIIIVLAIVVILLIYYIYTVLNAVPSVANNIDLTKPPTIIKSSSINDPYSANYTIGTWIYIFNFASNNQIGRFLLYGDAKNNGPNSFWSLRMDSSSPTLYCDILVNKSGSSGYQKQTVTITDNFPMQKWVYVVTSVSAGFIECYLNGAFVLAQTLTNTIYTGTPPTDPNSGATFTFGAQGTTMDDGTIRQTGSPMVLNLVSRWNYALSSGDIYNNYNKGNGQPTNIWGPAYHMNINLAQGTNNYVLPIF
jgi:hypothetical protein